MARSQNTPRETLATRHLEIGTNGTGSIEADSTGNLKVTKGLALSGQGGANAITQNSTGVKLPDGLALSGKVVYVTQNSTSVNIPIGLKVSGQANGVMTALSTGVVLTAIKIGAHWLTANSTGLKIGANQITTA